MQRTRDKESHIILTNVIANNNGEYHVRSFSLTNNKNSYPPLPKKRPKGIPCLFLFHLSLFPNFHTAKKLIIYSEKTVTMKGWRS